MELNVIPSRRERVTLRSPADPFLSLKALATYSGLSVRKLWALLGDPDRSLSHYKVGSKVLVRRGKFDAWVTGYRQTAPDPAKVVDEILGRLGSTGGTAG